jgi:hypothetical protein
VSEEAASFFASGAKKKEKEVSSDDFFSGKLDLDKLPGKNDLSAKEADAKWRAENPWKAKLLDMYASPESKLAEKFAEEGKGPEDVAKAGIGAAEGFTSAATGIPAGLAGGLNMSASLLGGRGVEDSLARMNETQQALTYKPRTPEGEQASEGISEVMGLPGAAGKWAGDKASELGAPPLLSAALATAPDAIAMLAGGRAAAAERPTRVPFERPKAVELSESPKNAIPTTAELTKASKEAYAAAKESGVVVPAHEFESTVGKVRDMVTEEGIDPTLHPRSTAVLKRIEQANGKDLTLQEAETLRKIAQDAENDLNPVTRQPTPDARLAGKIVDELDESIDALSVNSPARALWARSRRSQMLDQMEERAAIKAGAHYTQAGMEHALRQEFKQLALNPRRMRGFTDVQREAIKKVAAGGTIENAMRNIGKFDPSAGGMGSLVSLGTGGLVSTVSGPAGIAVPVGGFIAKRIATRMTKNNVAKAREALVGRGMPDQPIKLNDLLKKKVPE